ncbi:unnamed protein product [Lathyrus oleraceus]
MAKSSLMLIIVLFFIISVIEMAMAKECNRTLAGQCDAGACEAWCFKTYSGHGNCVQAKCVCSYICDT